MRYHEFAAEEQPFSVLDAVSMRSVVMETPKMTIETLILAARYVEEQDRALSQSQSPPLQQAAHIQQLQHQPPPAPPPHSQQHHHHLSQHALQQQPPPPPQVHHHVLQQQQPVQLQHVTIQHQQPTLQQQPPQQQPHQPVAAATTVATIAATIAAAAPAPTMVQPTNGNVASLATQQVNNLRKKGVPHVQMNPLAVMNSFDLINPPVIDQGSGEIKRKQPPMAFRTGTREVHNKLEKNRRAHLKECFDVLYDRLPNSRGNKKTSNLNILASAIAYIASLKQQQQADEKEMERLAKEKITLKQRIVALKKDIMTMYNVDVSSVMPDIKFEENVRVREPPKLRDYSKPRLNSLSKSSTSPPPPTTTTTMMKDGSTPNNNNNNNNVSVVNIVHNTPITTASATVPPTTTCINNVLKLPKSIKGALPVVTTTGTNGMKEETLQLHQAAVPAGAAPTTTATVQQTLSVLPFTTYPMNQNVVVQKVLMPQLTTHFITTQPPTLDGKVMPAIVNAQYVVKPLVVVSTPSRTS